ncbi:MAG: DUF2313 domain-containing protein [Gallionella sp.]|nr:DUF2313 domain-containing protein [Gallionella sp.]
MRHVDLLKQLLPYRSYDTAGRVLSAQLAAEGVSLDLVQSYADNLIAESDPRTCYLTIDDWERVAGLPDACAGVEASNIDARRTRLAAKLMTKGGSSVAWLIQSCAQMGYLGVTVDTFTMATCVGDCEQFVNSQEWLFAFRLNIPGGLPIHYANCEGSCQDALATWDTGGLVCRINKIKPAHTLAIFNYV